MVGVRPIEMYLVLDYTIYDKFVNSVPASASTINPFESRLICTNEPGVIGLCAQGIFHALSGYASIASGSGIVKVFIVT